jgi:SAM-dependent methyltransferase
MDLSTITDQEFDFLYPQKIKMLSSTHWTPAAIAKKAIGFLADEGKSVLDIGSGAGKFCLIAAANSKSKITGVEQRANLVQISRKLALTYQFENLNFVHDDIMNVDFTRYDNFYFFNSFEENINLKDKLDKDHEFNSDKFNAYILFLKECFDATPVGTKIVTYCGECAEIPESYNLLKSENKGKLKFWRKEI